jgi:hypothetical protein
MKSMNSIGKISCRVLFVNLEPILIMDGPRLPVTAPAQADTDPLPT